MSKDYDFVVTNFYDVPERFLSSKPTLHKGAFLLKWMNRPTDSNNIPNFIWVLKNDGQCKNYDDFIKIKVEIDSSTTVEENDSEKENYQIVDQDRHSRFEYFKSIDHIGVFHYVDEDAIKETFHSNFKEPVLSSILCEILQQDNVQAKATIMDVFGGNLERNEIAKWVTKLVLPEASIKEMYMKLQKYLLEHERALIGLEVVEPSLVDHDSVERFERSIAYVQRRLKLSLNSEEIKERRSEFLKKSVWKIVKDLSREDLKGKEALVYGKFRIEKDEDDVIFRLAHPVSTKYGQNISIVTLGVPEKSLSPPKAFKKLEGKATTLRVYAEVFQPLDLENNVTEVTLRPLAIY